MKRTLLNLVLLLFLSICALQAQTSTAPTSISWGEEIPKSSKYTVEEVVSAGPWGFYALRSTYKSKLLPRQFYAEHYDADMRLKRSVKLNLKYENKKRDFGRLTMVGGKLYLLTSFNNEATKKNYLFAQVMNNKLEPSQDLIKIGEIDTRNKYRDGEFGISISSDSSRVLIYNEWPEKKQEPARFTLRVYDNAFNGLWTKDVVLPYNSDRFSVEEYQIDNEGNVYLLGIAYEEKKNRTRRNGKPTYRYLILMYNNKGENLKEYKTELQDKFITDLTFRTSKDGKLVCSGFYSDKGTSSIKGTYFFRIDLASQEVSSLNLHAFDFELVSEFLTERQQRKAQKAIESDKEPDVPELYKFSLDHLILRSDGGAVLVAEQRYSYQTSTYVSGRTYTANHYVYNDVIVVNIRPNGEIEWVKRIPKRQHTTDDNGHFSSYAMTITPEGFYFVFNDNARNFEPDSRWLHNFNGKKSIVHLAHLTRDGELNSYPLFSNRDVNIITRPKICRQTGSRRMIVYGELKRSYRFAVVDFKG